MLENVFSCKWAFDMLELMMSELLGEGEEEMRNYKIICSDLDGTLLNNASKISRENLLAMEELVKRGAYFVPSTGRTFSELPEELKNSDSIRYIIHSNGAAVLDKQTGKCILVCISNAVMQEIMDILRKYEVHISVRHGGKLYVDGALDQEAVFDHYNVCEAHRVVVRDFAVCREGFQAFAYAAEDVEVVSVFFRTLEEKAACRAELEQLGVLRVAEADTFNLEIMNLHAGKGNALYSLADALGIDRADTISLGDSDNDASITQAAGLGLAVSNACESLKRVADAVICSNEEHVLTYVLSHYF